MENFSKILKQKLFETINSVDNKFEEYIEQLRSLKAKSLENVWNEFRIKEEEIKNIY